MSSESSSTPGGTVKKMEMNIEATRSFECDPDEIHSIGHCSILNHDKSFTTPLYSP